MKWFFSMLKSSALRWWFIVTASYSVSSTCPCCGKPGCPGVFIAGALLGAIVITIRAAFLVMKNIIRFIRYPGTRSKSISDL